MRPELHSAVRRRAAAALLAACAVAILPAPAHAANTIFWNWATLYQNVSVSNSGLSMAALDGSGGQAVTVTGAPVSHPLGMAIDSATGTIYWGNFGSSVNYCTGPLTGGNTISYARLNGTGGGTLNTSGATVDGPDGVAIDPAAARLYWANDHGNSISYANLDGSGGGDLNTAGATLNCPAGLAVDPAAGRVYWTNFHGNTISYANLNGSGGGDLNIAGASLNGPYGLAIDSADGHIYWANYTGNSIGYARLDGSGGDTLSTPGASPLSPWGVAIDPAAGRIYWASNLGSTVAYAKLDESGAGYLSAGGASLDHPKYPVLLEAPSGKAAPAISGGSAAGTTLTCSLGAWAPDLPESFLYRAPETFGYSWSKNGKPLAGSSASIAAGSPGRYACHVTATNYAGSTTLTSAAITVVRVPSNVVSLRISSGGALTLRVLVHARGRLTGQATFTAKTVRFTGSGARRHGVTRRTTLVYGAADVEATGAGTFALTIHPGRAARRLLESAKTGEVTVTVVFAPKHGAIIRARLHVPLSIRGLLASRR